MSIFHVMILGTARDMILLDAFQIFEVPGQLYLAFIFLGYFQVNPGLRCLCFASECSPFCKYLKIFDDVSRDVWFFENMNCRPGL